MSNTLIILAHPTMASSQVHHHWRQLVYKHPDNYTVHELYSIYANGKIDVAAEQQLVDAHKNLVLQFPVYWFNCPPLLKQWLDDVLTHGWAYGTQATALVDKKVALAISLGTPKADYATDGAIGHTVHEALKAFELTFRYCRADYQEPFVFHTIDSHGVYDDNAKALIAKSGAEYLTYLQKLNS